MRFSAAALLWAASGAAAVPAVQQPANSSIEQPGGFEVTIVYAQPQGGCPAKKLECPPEDIFGRPAAKPSTSSSGHGSSSSWGSKSGPILSQEAQAVKLKPAVHWGTDTSKISNVVPLDVGSGNQLYYGSPDPRKSGYLGFLTYHFGAPSVNLDNCGYVTSVACTATGCAVSFSSKAAYDRAVKTWDANLILIASTKGCAGHANGDRCFFSVTAIDFQDGLVIVVKGSFKDPETIMDKAEANWGWWEPNRAPRPSGDSTASATSIRSATLAPSPTSSSGPSGGSASSSSGTFSHASSVTSSRAPFPTGRAGSNSTFTTTDDGNSTSNFGETGACYAPADTKHGLPTACWGDYFDADLDEDLGDAGGLSANFNEFVKMMAPGMDMDGVDLAKRDMDGLSEFDHLNEKRWKWLKKIAKTFVKVVTAPITYPASAIILIANGGKPPTTTLNKDISFRLPDPSKPGSDANKLQGGAKQVMSPWGDAILIKSFGDQSAVAAGKEGLSGYMNIFCVGCGASGSISLTGKVTWLPTGIISATVDVKADADMKLKLGVDAQIRYEKNIKTTLLRVGLPGLSYGVITIGPWIEAGVRVGFTALAKGRLLAGAEMGLANCRATLNLLDSSKSNKAGWDPQFKPIFEAEGEIIISAELGLPIGIKLGIAVPGFKLDGGIVDEPSIKATAQVAASVGLTPAGTFSAGFKDINGCTGICTQISWRNVLFLEFAGKMIGKPLHDTGDMILDRGCIKLPGRPDAGSGTGSGSGSGTGPSSGSEENPGSGSGAETPGAGTGSGSGSENPGTGSGSGNPDAGTGSENPGSGSGTGSGSENPGAGTGSGSGSEPGTATGSGTDPEGTHSPEAGAGSGSGSGTGSGSEPSGSGTEPSGSGTEPSGSGNDANLDTRSTAFPKLRRAATKFGNATAAPSNGTIRDMTSSVKSNVTELTYTPTSLPNSPYNTSNGYEYSLLTVQDGSMMFIACSTGAIYAVDPNADIEYCTEMWATYEDIVVADGATRLMHYYANTMAAVGVSRLVVGDEADIPKQAVPVALSPDDLNAEDGYYYLAVDPDYNVFYPVMCGYADGSSPRLFVARDPVKGVEMLESPDVAYSVTGGKVTKCYAMQLLMGEFEGEGNSFDKYVDHGDSDKYPFDLDETEGGETGVDE
ncbi:hypothetical protein RB595_000224 [Gaeumannomyces hyphopodioides]